MSCALVVCILVACGGSGDGAADDAGITADATIADAGVDAPPGGCTPGTTVCTRDRHAFRGCGLEPVAGMAGYGPPIPCHDGDQCQDGACVTTRCTVPELLFVVDRSDSVHWSMVETTLSQLSLAHAVKEPLRGLV